jgi:hypothetical protein
MLFIADLLRLRPAEIDEKRRRFNTFCAGCIQALDRGAFDKAIQDLGCALIGRIAMSHVIKNQVEAVAE